MAPGKGWLDWLLSEERRHARRRKSVPLVAYYWDGATPIAHTVRDVSPSGLYLLTEHRWYPGTVLAMTLQRTEAETDDAERAIAVNARVVRAGEDGVGFEFIVPEKNQDPRQHAGLPIPLVSRKQLQSFFSRLGETKGQALIEYILVLPMLFLLVLNVVNFGGFFYAWITVADAARAGANYAVLGGAAAGRPGTPTLAQVTSLITAEVSSLPNNSSTVVTACQRTGATTIKFGGGSCSGITLSADPETGYSSIKVQVQYTYRPYISAFSFPKLGVHLTIPPTTITQTSVMRALL
ncbi:MAG TPA: TadE/TadG family type IV pilus assembly protein [Acidobacteriaceae bacterium]|nr:TadE/TadG family type IV pilus assembly protein [Acidobacteriaceae bacterium]